MSGTVRDVTVAGMPKPAGGGRDAEPVVAAGRGDDGRILPPVLAPGRSALSAPRILKTPAACRLLKLQADLAAVGTRGQQRGSAHVGAIRRAAAE